MTVATHPVNMLDAVRADVLAFLLKETHDWCEPTAPCWHDTFRPIRDSWAASKAASNAEAKPPCVLTLRGCSATFERVCHR